MRIVLKHVYNTYVKLSNFSKQNMMLIVYVLITKWRITFCQLNLNERFVGTNQARVIDVEQFNKQNLVDI